MRRTRFLAVTMAAVMSVSMFTSCKASAKKGAKVVKEDDPWYESTRFELMKDIDKGNSGCTVDICVSNDRIFSLYCVSPDLWNTSRTVLDTYDFEGNHLSRRDITFPDKHHLIEVTGSYADPEGKTITAVVEFADRIDGEAAFVEIDTESGKVTGMEDLIGEKAKRVIKPEFDIFDIVSSGNYTIALLWGTFRTGGDTNRQILLFKDQEFVRELELSNITFMWLLDGFSIDESTNSIFIGVYDYDDTSSLEFDITTGKLKNVRSFREVGGGDVDFAEYAATDKGDFCKIDSLGNVVKIDTDTMIPKTVIDTNWYTPYFYPVYSDEQGVQSKLINYSEERTVIVDYEYLQFGFDVPEQNFYIRVLTKAEKNPNAGKEIVEIALPPNSGVSDYLAKTIFEFNKTDNEYLLRVWDKYKSGYTVGLVYGALDENDQEVYKMIQDLKNDDAPDIALNIQKNYAMRDDVFMDLTGFLDPEVLEKQYGNIIEAGRYDGKLYFLPVTLEIEGLVTNKELIKDGAAGLTFEEFEKLIKDEMNGFSPYDYPNSRAYNKRTFLLSCIDTKRAIEGQKIEFGTDQFRAAAEYAKDSFVYDNEKSVPEDYKNDWTRFRGECYYTRIGDYLDFVCACNKSNASYKIIGTPSTDASGPRFKAIETVSVSALTDVKDGCKKFLNYMFSGSAYNSDDCKFRFIVTNKEIMDRNIEILTRNNNDEYSKYLEGIKSGKFIPAPGLDKAYGQKEATDDMSESFKESLSSISTYYYEDHTIIEFVDEELAPYYAGDRSLDDAIRYLNDRAAKYVREM